MALMPATVVGTVGVSSIVSPPLPTSTATSEYGSKMGTLRAMMTSCVGAPAGATVGRRVDGWMAMMEGAAYENDTGGAVRADSWSATCTCATRSAPVPAGSRNSIMESLPTPQPAAEYSVPLLPYVTEETSDRPLPWKLRGPKLLPSRTM